MVSHSATRPRPRRAANAASAFVLDASHDFLTPGADTEAVVGSHASAPSPSPAAGRAAPGPGPLGQSAPFDVDVIVPVHNEERALARSIYRLHRFLSVELPFSWRIVIADNASRDLTPDIGRALARTLPLVTLLRLPEQGRGRALRAAWSASQARVVCYMDVDLSTDLKALLPLLAPLLSGHSELAIGTRLGTGAHTERGIKRELISRSYNFLLRALLHASFSDAQCGFKAVRCDVVPDLLAGVHDQGWFFDTELLILAQRRGLRIHEVPVDWVEDADSRVDILATAMTDLRGIARLRKERRRAHTRQPGGSPAPLTGVIQGS
ncbi:MAG: glycosyltransferase family 2 protein [Solirubrobacterales bacterium]|nr:glycosyltransferase family 2 protein [Solirubrobacterales bacterium]